MKSGTLVVIEGRVLARQGARCIIEHGLAAPAAPGTCWHTAGGGLLETLEALNPTEVAAIVRNLPAPEVGEVLERGGSLALRLEAGAGQLGGGAGWPVLAPELRAAPELGERVWTGLPAVDLLAPLRAGALLGLFSETREGLEAHLGCWAAAARQSGRRVIWAGPSRWLGQAAPGDVVLSATADAPGGLASLGRQVATAAAALMEQGERVALALEDLGAWVGAWAEADGQGLDARSVAPYAVMDALKGALHSGEACGIVTVGGAWSAGPALSSTAELELEKALGGWAELEEGQLQLRELRAMGAEAPVAASTREILMAAAEIEEFEEVFGTEELSEAQQALRAMAVRLEEVLSGCGAPVALEEVLERCTAVILRR